MTNSSSKSGEFSEISRGEDFQTFLYEWKILGEELDFFSKNPSKLNKFSPTPPLSDTKILNVKEEG